MPQPAPRFSDDDLAAAVDAGESLDAFAARFGVRFGLVQSRLRRLRIERGEQVRASGDFTWDQKLRFEPTREAVERLYAYEGAAAVEERWGRPYGDLRRAVGPSRRESVRSGAPSRREAAPGVLPTPPRA